MQQKAFDGLRSAWVLNIDSINWRERHLRGRPRTSKVPAVECIHCIVYLLHQLLVGIYNNTIVTLICASCNILQLGTCFSLVLLCLVPHHAPQNLPTGRLGYHIDKVHPATQPLVRSYLVGDPPGNFGRLLLALLNPFLERDVRTGELCGLAGVVDTNDTGVRDIWVP